MFPAKVDSDTGSRNPDTEDPDSGIGDPGTNVVYPDAVDPGFGIFSRSFSKLAKNELRFRVSTGDPEKGRFESDSGMSLNAGLNSSPGSDSGLNPRLSSSRDITTSGNVPSKFLRRVYLLFRFDLFARPR